MTGSFAILEHFPFWLTFKFIVIAYQGIDSNSQPVLADVRPLAANIFAAYKQGGKIIILISIY